jgi:hypothetical protein
VQLRRGADADGVDAVDGDQVLPFLEEVRYAVLGAEALQCLGLESRERHHFDVGQLRERLQCGPPGKTETDHSDP